MFVRGLANITNITRIEENIGETSLGVVYPELRTKNDTLSIWHIERKEDFLDAALSIVIPRDKLDAAVFLVIDEDVLEQHGVEYRHNPPNRECVENSKAVHYDMINVRVNNIQNVLAVYRDAYLKELESGSEERVIHWTANELKQNVEKALKEGKVKHASLNGNLKKAFQV